MMKTKLWVILCTILLIGSVVVLPVMAQTQSDDFIIIDADDTLFYDTSAYTGSTEIDERYIYEYLDWKKDYSITAISPEFPLQVADRYIYEYLDWKKDYSITAISPEFPLQVADRYIYEYLDWEKDYFITAISPEFPLQVADRFIFEYLDWSRNIIITPIPPEFPFPRIDPAPFSKITPTIGATNQSISLTLDWEESDVQNYEYCINTTPTCSEEDWISTGSISQTDIAGLIEESTYYWQVRTSNAFAITYANDGEWWHFSTIESFGKSRPQDGADKQKTRLNLYWEEYTGAVSYEYCVDKVLDDKCSSPSEWVNVGSATSATVSRLKMETTYEWQVNAIDSNGVRTPADKGDWWIFTTKPKPIPNKPMSIE